MSADYAALRAPIVSIARRAGAAIMTIYRSDFAVSHKSDRSPLTEADMAAHHIIVDALHRLTPDWPVLSEESADVPFATRGRWQRYWLVDPLDGTREFVKRNGEFTVNIALIEQGRPRLGVVYAPDRDELFHAQSGVDALVERADSPPRKLRAVARSAQRTPWRVAGSRSHGDPRLQTFLAPFGDHEIIALGSSLKFCLIAEGGADVYVRFGPTSEWDTAAGQCVLEQSGGQVADMGGARLDYNQKESLLNPDFIACAGNVEAWLGAR